MSEEDIESTRRRYGRLAITHGDTDESVGWGPKGRALDRYRIMAQGLELEGSRVLDVGGGYGNAFTFFRAEGVNSYTCVDLTPELVALGESKFGGIEGFQIISADFLTHRFSQTYDFVFISGLFNFLLLDGNNYSFISRVLSKSADLSQRAVVANFLSNRVDFVADNLFYSDPIVIWGIANRISPRVILRSDYYPFEFGISIFSPAQIDRESSKYMNGAD